MANKEHLPNLDGLRTIAAFLVLMQHSNHFPSTMGAPYYAQGRIARLFFGTGTLAVEFFFVLSGFLITRIVLNQMDSPKGFSVGRFWLRRVLRIWPVYYMVVLVAILMAHLGGSFFSMQFNSYPLLLCFLENFDLIRMSDQGHPNGLIASVLWSVSIEEQFYLVYPLLLLSLPRRAYLPAFGLIVLSSGYLRVASPSLFHTPNACYGLALGCVLAQLVRGKEFGGVHRVLLLVPYLVTLLMLLVDVNPNFATLAFPVLFACIVFDQAFCPQSLMQTRYLPGLNTFGKVTYGLYSYHMVIVMLIFQFLHSRGLDPQGPFTFALYVAAIATTALGVSWLSYRRLETPILVWGQKQMEKAVSRRR